MARRALGATAGRGRQARPGPPSPCAVVGWCGAGWRPRGAARGVRRPWWRTCGPSAGPVRAPARRSSRATAATRWDHAQPAITAGQRPRPDFWHPTGLTVFPHLSGAISWPGLVCVARPYVVVSAQRLGPAHRCRAIFRWCGHCRASWRTSGSDGVACRARCSRGAADDQLWFQRDVLRFACGLVESLDDGFDGGSGLLLDVLADGGEVDPGESSEPGVVVPDDRQIAGHGDACPEDGVESADGAQVVRGDNGGG